MPFSSALSCRILPCLALLAATLNMAQALAFDPHSELSRNRLKSELHDQTLSSESETTRSLNAQSLNKATIAPVPTPAAKSDEEEEVAPATRFKGETGGVTAAARKQHEASALLFAKRKDWEEAANHAKRSGAGPMQGLIEWMRLRDGDTVGAFEDYAYFLARPKEWPDVKIMLQHAEEALLINGGKEADIRRWYEFAAKISGKQKPQGDITTAFIRQAYAEGDFTTFEDNAIRTRYSNIIRPDDTAIRADRLVWEERYTQAQRLISELSPNERGIIETRLALMQEQLRARILYAGLSSRQKMDPGVLFAAMRYAMKKKDDDTAEKYLLAAPKSIPYPDKWWKTRASLIRDAIEAGNYPHAQRLLDSAGDLTSDEKTEALFMDGWLNLQFKDNAKVAYKKFYDLFSLAKFPVSKARAAYWAGVAAEKSGNKNIAFSWFAQGAAYPTQFYGQLCAMRHHGNDALRIPATPIPNAQDKARAGKRPAAEALRILSRENEPLLADKFLTHLIDTSDSDGEIAYYASLATDGESNYLGVKAAKRALRANVVLARQGWPRVKYGFVPTIEPALMFAITRQESEFRANVRSSANAVGMMQLLPKTAKMVAQKHDIKYKKEAQLEQPAFNMLLGSYYLGGLVDKYDGNYMLAIASYNAGPTNVNQWIGRFGTPGKSVEQSLKWLEQIPFSETRNYVQRVLENLQVYRHLLAEKSQTPSLKIEKDLVHPTQIRSLPKDD